jgi:ribosomal protein S3
VLKELKFRYQVVWVVLKWPAPKFIKRVESHFIHLRADIDYALGEALTKVGLIGIKVWICNGEVFGKRDLSPNVEQLMHRQNQDLHLRKEENN